MTTRKYRSKGVATITVAPIVEGNILYLWISEAFPRLPRWRRQSTLPHWEGDLTLEREFRSISWGSFSARVPLSLCHSHWLTPSQYSRTEYQYSLGQCVLVMAWWLTLLYISLSFQFSSASYKSLTWAEMVLALWSPFNLVKALHYILI